MRLDNQPTLAPPVAPQQQKAGDNPAFMQSVWVAGLAPAASPIHCKSRSAAAVWPVHPQRSCYWHSLQGQSRRSGTGLRRQQGSRFSSKFSPSVMSSARLRTAGCVHQRLKDQTSMGFIHGFVRASAHNPHSHRMKDIDDGCCGSPPDLDGAGGCEASGKDRTGDAAPPNLRLAEPATRSGRPTA